MRLISKECRLAELTSCSPVVFYLEAVIEYTSRKRGRTLFPLTQMWGKAKLDFGTAFNGIAAVGSVAAVTMSLVLTRRVISQTERLSKDAHKLAAEDHLQSRFDVIFQAVDKLLEALSDLKADLVTHRRQAAANSASQSLAISDVSDRVEGSFEHFRTRTLFLGTILIGLPEASAEGSVGRLSDAVRRVEDAKSWLAAVGGARLFECSS